MLREGKGWLGGLWRWLKNGTKHMILVSRIRKSAYLRLLCHSSSASSAFHA